MAKVRRFFYVMSPRSTRRHIQFGASHTEGLTACGRPVRAGWSWWHAHSRWRKPPLLCSQCERGHEK